MSQNRPKPVVLCVLDGWGESDTREHNAIAQALTPTMDRLRAHYPRGVLSASEGDVGLPGGQMGNSEVGHMNIGAGRIVMQDLPRIDAAIADGSLAKNPQLATFVAALKKSGGTAHLLGLVSDGGVHAHQAHIAALANAISAAGVPVAIHAFLDGRDTAPQSAKAFMAQLQSDAKGATVATISGRYYAMDRDKRWERVEQAYKTLTTAQGEKATDATSAIAASYEQKKNDEFVLPTVIGGYTGMKDGDGLVMANFRADRARQLLRALIDPNFKDFARTPIKFAATLGMVEYSDKLNPLIPAMFPQQTLEGNLGELVSNAGLQQLRIAETEKYAHVTFFFSGGREEPYKGEERILVPSPQVATYDLKPEMSAPEMTDKLVEAINSQRFDFIVVNYANTDMVGHSGDIKAAMKAVEAVDTCLGRVCEALDGVGGAMLITADHGNAECLHDDDSGQPHTAHTLNFVPAILVSKDYVNTGATLPQGILADIAPTIMDLLGLPKPTAMTGRSLIAHLASHASVA